MSVDEDRILGMSKALSYHVFELETKIENYQAYVVFRSSIKSVLSKLGQELSKEILDTKELNQCAYAIFRLVTESSVLEASSFGKELLTLDDEIRTLTRLIDGNNEIAP